MAETAADLVGHVLPEQPIRQQVLSFPYPLRFLFATRSASIVSSMPVVRHLHTASAHETWLEIYIK